METFKEIALYRITAFLGFIVISSCFVTSNWNIFSRFGAFLTVLGLWLIIKEFEEWNDSDIVQRFPKRSEGRIYHVPSNNEEKYDFKESILKDARNNSEKIKKRLKNVANWYVLAGTIIWGFGDLIGMFF